MNTIKPEQANTQQYPIQTNIPWLSTYTSGMPLPQTEGGCGRYFYSVFHLIISLVAIYLSFRCNNGFHLGGFIIALLCPYLYIIYILATKGTCGILEKK